MKATIKIAMVNNELLEEESLDVVFEANDKTYIGALFFEKEDLEEITEVLEEVTMDDSVLNILLKAYEMMKKHGRIADDDQTFKSMVHWQFMNGFSDDSLSELRSYAFETDTELFESLSENSPR